MELIRNNIIFTDPAQVAEMDLYNEPFYEQWMLTNIQKLPYRKGVWLDIGAHVGNHTIFFSNHCQADEVWAYEPTPSTFAILEQNVNNNPGNVVRLFNCAVGAKKGYCTVKESKNGSGKNSITKSKGKTKLEIVGDISASVALIKIDVEGFEFEVLKGAMPVIERDFPELFVETFEPMEKVLEMLPKGYRLVGTYNNAPTYHFSASKLSVSENMRTNP